MRPSSKVRCKSSQTLENCHDCLSPTHRWIEISSLHSEDGQIKSRSMTLCFEFIIK